MILLTNAFNIVIIFFSRVNAEILGTMFAQACYHFNFAYIIYIMNMVKHEEIKPNKKFMDRLDCFNKTIKDLIKKRVSFNINKKL